MRVDSDGAPNQVVIGATADEMGVYALLEQIDVTPTQYAIVRLLHQI